MCPYVVPASALTQVSLATLHVSPARITHVSGARCRDVITLAATSRSTWPALAASLITHAAGDPSNLAITYADWLADLAAGHRRPSECACNGALVSCSLARSLATMREASSLMLRCVASS